MKLFKQILLLSLTLLFISCSSEDSTPIDINAQEEDLVGTWNLIEESQDGIVSPNDIPVNGSITSVGKDLDAQIAFTANPKNYTGSGSYTDVIKITAVGQTLAEGELIVPISDIINQGTWSLNEGVLSLTENGIVQEVNITELTAATLKVEFEIKVDNVTYQGFTGDIESTIKMTFQKQ